MSYRKIKKRVEDRVISYSSKKKKNLLYIEKEKY